ncbi:MAG: Gfo/Idh/MocA family protein [Limisphaerales bacterium]
MPKQFSFKRLSRRNFVKTTGAAAAATFGFQYVPSHVWGVNSKPALAGIGAGGKGRADIPGSDSAGFQIVALCDVVNTRKVPSNNKLRTPKGLDSMREKYSGTEFYTDYRELIADMGDKIDAVTVSTPDHHHFHASALAMKAGKHVYCQKPLTHGIWEARKMTEIAAETGVKTQMGNQAHANSHMRRCVELIRAGIIGKVQEVHAWTNRPSWPQGFKQPPEKQAVPEWLDWDQWCGPAPFVEYSSVIAPFSWRGWWNYGTGALGDMACHIMDMGYWALMPGAPRSVSAVERGATELSPPIDSKITWEFGPSKYTDKGGFKYFWYDGYTKAYFDREKWTLVKESNEYNHPGKDVLEDQSFKDFGSVIIGTEGKMFFHRARNTWVVKPNNRREKFDPKETIPRATNDNNYQEWIDAIAGKVQRGQSDFSHSGPFTETILLGVLAQRNPNQKLRWNSKKLEVKGRPELKKFIQRPYRKGWEIDV